VRTKFKFNFKDGSSAFIDYPEDLSSKWIRQIDAMINNGLKDGRTITLANETDVLRVNCANVSRMSIERWEVK